MLLLDLSYFTVTGAGFLTLGFSGLNFPLTFEFAYSLTLGFVYSLTLGVRLLPHFGGFSPPPLVHPGWVGPWGGVPLDSTGVHAPTH